MKARIIIISCSTAFVVSGCQTAKVGAFRTPERAGEALQLAASEQDQQKLNDLFGEGFIEYVQSGDPIADELGLKQLAILMDEKTQAVARDDGAMVLHVGKNEQPFPVPLVKTDGYWEFDSTEGAETIIDRRIGDNELRAIKIAQFYADAQKLYHSKDRNGDGVKEYARRFSSTPGQRDGLYWENSSGKPEASPFGPLVGKAVEQGYEVHPERQGDPLLRGYHFRIIESQGREAAGGKRNYLDGKGRMTRGFALLAYPAAWERSGVMSFIVGPDGQVYEKNLGPDTLVEAAKISSFNPDRSWKPVSSTTR